jgi:hypothetical protein
MGANTNSPVVLSILAFYITIIILMGLIGESFPEARASVSGNAALLQNPGNPSTSPLSVFDYVGVFFAGLSFTLSSIPFWANTILFLPLIFTLGYVLASFVRGSS